MQLSRFFTLAELTRSDTASRENIPNDPTTELEHLRALCTSVLDPLREAIGRPIRVNSGYRGPALNARIGGAKKSQHCEGKAADIQSPGMSVLDLFKTVIRSQLPFDQVIYEAQSRTVKWVHVSHDPTRDRRQIRVAEFGPNGRPIRYPVISTEEALAMSDPPSRAAIPPVWGYTELPDEPEPMQPSKQRSSVRRTRTRPNATKLTKPKNRAPTKSRISKVPSARKTKARTLKGKSAPRAKKRRA